MCCAIVYFCAVQQTERTFRARKKAQIWGRARNQFGPQCFLYTYTNNSNSFLMHRNGHRRKNSSTSHYSGVLMSWPAICVSSRIDDNKLCYGFRSSRHSFRTMRRWSMNRTAYARNDDLLTYIFNVFKIRINAIICGS